MLYSPGQPLIRDWVENWLEYLSLPPFRLEAAAVGKNKKNQA
jgi:hypothetical protein